MNFGSSKEKERAAILDSIRFIKKISPSKAL
jgi:hypothetical protein